MMEEILGDQFGEKSVVNLNKTCCGCINEGYSYQVGHRKIFVKTNTKNGADLMFEGEMESLLAIEATNIIKVPHPYKVFKYSEGFAIAMDYLDIRPLQLKEEGLLGIQLAQLHMSNIKKIKELDNTNNCISSKQSSNSVVQEYGFGVPTSCGFFSLDNMWSTDWIKFFSRQRLQNKIDLIQQEYGDRLLQELWSELQLNLDKLFLDVKIYPSLLHGDLWSGNAGRVDKLPVIFDPASFYGHHEFDLAIAKMFGGFDQSLFSAYHSIIPKSPGFDGRIEIYKLFHYLNHWNHFGSGYRSSSIETLRKVLYRIKSRS